MYPKPVQGAVPIALGNAGRVGIQHAAEYADQWCPIDAQLLNDSGRPDVVGGIELFRRLAAEAGRDAAAIPITIFAFGRLDRDRIESYAELGVERIVFPPTTMNRHDEQTAPDAARPPGAVDRRAAATARAGRMTRPVGGFGAKNVDFGGMSTCSVAVRRISAIGTGRSSTPHWASAARSAPSTRSTPCW